VGARVIDAYSIKPMNPTVPLAAFHVTGGRIVVVEDHHPEGGLGAAVRQVLVTSEAKSLQLAHLAVRQLPMSGTSAELLDFEQISARHIEAAARSLLGRR
jgi:transketolase